MVILESLATAAAQQLVRECVSRHADDLAIFAKSAKETVNKQIKHGWKQDYQAGGISSWNFQEGKRLESA